MRSRIPSRETLMFAGSQTDMCVGLDIHMEMVPMPAPVPTPFPMPFVGEVEYSAVGVLMGMGIGKAMSFFTGSPPSGPVVVNGFQCVKTGDEAKNKETLPHFVIPPGTAWTPLPKPLKLKISPPPPAPDNPAAPPGDAVFITGSKTVLFEQSSACRLGTLAMSCSDPVRLPSSVLLAVPKGLPVIVGGPDAIDWIAAAKAFFLRNKWTAGLLHQLVSLLPAGRLQNLLGKGVCFLTGHPVDVATGRLLTWSEDFVLRGPIPLPFERNYSSGWAERPSTLGHGWSHTYDERVWVERGRVVYLAGDGREIEFHTHDLPGRVMVEGQEIFYPIDRLTLRCLGRGRWTIRSAQGHLREFERAADGNPGISQISRVVDRQGHSVRFYYRAGYLERVEQPGGRAIHFEHRDGHLVRVTVPATNGDRWYDQVCFEYSAEGNLVASYDSAKRAKTYAYEEHLLVRETDRDGVTFWFEYDGRDSTARCVRTWGSDGKTTDRLMQRSITYDVAGHKTFVENSLGNTTIYETNWANAVVKITDAHGNTTTYEYDEHLWMTRSTNEIGATTIFAYDTRGNEVAVELPTGARYEMRYDERDQVVEERDPDGVTKTWFYDERNRLRDYSTTAGHHVHIDYGSVWPIRIVTSGGLTLSLAHDVAGQLTKVTRSDGGTEENDFDAQGHLIAHHDASRRTTRFAYDREGRLASVRHPGGTVQSFERSGEGKVVLAQDGLTTRRYGYEGYHQLAWIETAGERVSYGRDSEDNIVECRNEIGETYRFVRDTRQRIVEEVPFDGSVHKYTLDALGRTTQRILPDGKEVLFTYEGEATHISYPDGAWERFELDSLGRLMTAANPEGTVRLERDACGRLAGESFEGHWARRTNDTMGRCLSLQTARGFVQRMERNPTGEICAVSVGDDKCGPSWQTSFELDLTGRPSRRTSPGAVEIDLDYDLDGHVTRQQTRADGGIVDETHYTWLGLTRLTAKRSAHGSSSYLHDGQDRLVAERSDAGTRWRCPDACGALYETPDRQDRLYDDGALLRRDLRATYSYDPNGNLAEKRLIDGSVWRYTWSSTGLLKSVLRPDNSEVSFKYDALGRRIAKTFLGRTTHWSWSGDNPIHEWTTGDGGESAPTSWIFAPDDFRPLGKVAPDGDVLAIQHDYLGSARSMFDKNGRSVWSADMDIYGTATVRSGSIGDCPWRWPGQYADEETGLYYNRFRYYDPQRGDYLSRDPLLFAGLLPGSNLYAYTLDPLSWIDLLALLGVIYLRQIFDTATDKAVGQEYVGQAISDARYLARQAEHERDLQKAFPGLGLEYRFTPLETSVPVGDLSKLEEDWIRAGDGPGALANKRHQMNDDRYQKAGGCMPK